MKLICRNVITDIFDKMGVNYSVKVPKKGTEMYSGHDTMFMITKDNNLIYFTDFEISPDDICYEVTGKMYFITPSGDLSHDWVEINLSLFIKADLWDTFIIVTDDTFEYIDFDDYVRELILSTPVKETKSHLSDFIKSDIEIL